jgi:hypothetical protein
MDDPEASRMEKSAAARLILTADKHNIDIVKMSIPKKIEHVDYGKLSDEDLHKKINELLKFLPTPLTTSVEDGEITDE